MFKEPPRRFHRCYISAPFGIDLGSLPVLLGNRQIAWNWAVPDIPGELGYATGIKRCDFIIAVLDGSRSDHRVLYEMGVAEGLGKPIFVVAINKRANTFATSKFAVATVGLNEANALAFQLDLFLSTPHESIFVRGKQSSAPSTRVTPKVARGGIATLEGFALEKRIFDEIIEAGGSAIAEPRNDLDLAAPDLLMWLPLQEPALLDPAVIEVKATATVQIAKNVERQLLPFMQAGGIQSAILLTQDGAPRTFRSTVPYFFWLSIDQFVGLIQSGNLGAHLRHLRNRAAHGMP
ncbi:nucleoside 2-deoxyribosyltransferase [Rhizobium leguminosarum]